jgi:hypothetical protein
MTLFKKKKELTNLETIENEFMLKYNLVKDTSEPTRYWINNDIHINILMSDDVSRSQAEKAIQEYYRTPKLTPATEEQKKNKSVVKSGGMGGFLENAGKGAEKVFGPIGDQFMKNAPGITNDLSGTGMNTMRDGVKNAQMLGTNNSSLDDMGISPKIDMDTILGQVNKSPVVKPKGRPPLKGKK